MPDTAVAMPRNLLRIGDLDADQLSALLDVARPMKRDPKGVHGAWVSIDAGAEEDERYDELRSYQVNAVVMSEACSDALLMQRLPEHRGEEVTGKVIDGPQSLVLEQAANRLPAEQAAIHARVSDRARQDRRETPTRAGGGAALIPGATSHRAQHAGVTA